METINNKVKVTSFKTEFNHSKNRAFVTVFNNSNKISQGSINLIYCHGTKTSSIRYMLNSNKAEAYNNFELVFPKGMLTEIVTTIEKLEMDSWVAPLD